MSAKRLFHNPDQQPGRRNFRRERDQYFRDEERDFERGVDYISQDRRRPNSYRNRDYAANNLWNRKYPNQRNYSDQLYTPSFGYGYSRDEYYDMDDAHTPHQQHEAVGYGNYGSQQSQDFEDWLKSSGRHRNFSRAMVDEHDYHRERPSAMNHDFEDGLSGYRNRRPGEVSSYDRYHNRSGRHPVLVRPFKQNRDYGRNDYNETEGFGSNEMAYHYPDRRSDDRMWPEEFD